MLRILHRRLCALLGSHALYGGRILVPKRSEQCKVLGFSGKTAEVYRITRLILRTWRDFAGCVPRTAISRYDPCVPIRQDDSQLVRFT